MVHPVYSTSGEKYNPQKRPRCILPHRDDGKWDHDKGIWAIKPCKRKSCPKHWRKFALGKFHKLRPYIDAGLLTYHLRISTRIKHVRGNRYQYLSNFLKALFDIPGVESTIWVKHRNRRGIHYHIVLQSLFPVDINDIRPLWQKHRPAKRKVQWHGSMVSLRPWDNGGVLLWYALGLSKKKVRILPPWRNEKGQVARRYRPRRISK